MKFEYTFEGMKLKVLDETFAGKVLAFYSFLLHGYYNFRHILIGRVRDNLDNTKYIFL